MTEQTPEPLDPDQVKCPVPSCLAPIAHPCVTPAGAKSRTVHMPRRRLAARGGVEPSKADQKREPTNPAGPPASARSKGGKATAQARRRRKAEIEAQLEQQRVEAEQRALEAQAAALAEDAARYARDRAMLRRQVLDAGVRAHEILLEGIRDRKRVVLDSDQRATTTPVEVFDEYGERMRNPETGDVVTREVTDVRGYVTTADLERLAKVAASTLNSLRLEEGKPTGITQDNSGSAAAGLLGEAGVEELLKYAEQHRDEL